MENHMEFLWRLAIVSAAIGGTLALVSLIGTCTGQVL